MPGLLECFEHPIATGASILVHGSRMGGVTIAEALGRGEPRVLVRAATLDNMPVIGLGMHKVGEPVWGGAIMALPAPPLQTL